MKQERSATARIIFACLLLCGCERYEQIPIPGSGTPMRYLNYNKVCVEGVTYIVQASGGITAQFDRNGKVIPCQ